MPSHSGIGQRADTKSAPAHLLPPKVRVIVASAMAGSDNPRTSDVRVHNNGRPDHSRDATAFSDPSRVAMAALQRELTRFRHFTRGHGSLGGLGSSARSIEMPAGLPGSRVSLKDVLSDKDRSDNVAKYGKSDQRINGRCQ